MTTNTGGPAFPSVLYSHERAADWSTDGMTLRDYFAAKAMLGYLSGRNSGDPKSGMHPEMVAADCYSYADAMLKEREK